jgi:hypothetical protein
MKASIVCLAHQYTYPVHFVDEIKDTCLVSTTAGFYESFPEVL